MRPDKEHAISRITNFAGGTAKDLDALRAVFEEAAAIVERNLPGTLVYEIFGNKKTSRFVARGGYVDSAAFQKHVERLMETGVLARMAELADFDLNISLGDVDDDVRDLLHGPGFETYVPLAKARTLEHVVAGGVTFSSGQLWPAPLELASGIR